MNVDVGSPNIDTIQATSVSSSDDHVVHLPVGAGVHCEVEGRRVDQGDIMNAKVRNLVESKDPRSVTGKWSVFLHSIPVLVTSYPYVFSEHTS